MLIQTYIILFNKYFMYMLSWSILFQNTNMLFIRNQCQMFAFHIDRTKINNSTHIVRKCHKRIGPKENCQSLDIL